MSNVGSDNEGTCSEERTVPNIRNLIKFPGTQPRRGRKPQFRWNYAKDLVLVGEVEKLEPFKEVGKAASLKWSDIASAISDKYPGTAKATATGVKERFNRILKDHKTDDFKNRYKSGTEVEVTILTQRLADLASKIHDRQLEEDALAAEKSKKVDAEKAAGEEIRNVASTTLKRKGTESTETPPHKRSSEKNLMELWKEKQELDRKMDQQRLDREMQQRDEDRKLRREEVSVAREKLAHDAKCLELEQEKVRLDREKFNAQTKLASDRFELEKLERSNQMKTQEALIQLLCKR